MIWVYILFFFSGCASLIYEVVWTRQLMLLLGSTTYAITTVIVAFMSGLALGSYVAGRVSHGLRQPGRVYAGLETVIGFYAIVVPVLMSAAEPMYRALYPHAMDMPGLLTSTRFLVSLVILIIPTACMGATLPLMMTHVTRSGCLVGRSTGWLYGLNTLGATLGSLLAGFWLMPALGLTHTTWVAAGINFAVGVAGMIVLRTAGVAVPEAGTESTARTPGEPTPEVIGTAKLVLLTAAVSGLASMTYQIAWTRSLVMSVGSTTYSFTCILAAFILGIGLGSLVIARFADRIRQPATVLGWFEFGIGLSAAVIIPVHGYVPILSRHLVTTFYEHYDKLVLLEFLLIVAVTAVPTFLMGAAFPLMTRIAAQRYSNVGEAIGRVYVINTIGTIVGALLTGFLLIRGEVLGIRGSITVAALLNAAVGVWLLVRATPTILTRGTTIAIGAIGLVVIGAVGAFVSPWNLELLSSAPFRSPLAPVSERKILFYREDVDTTVAVFQTESQLDRITLTVNGKPDASTDHADILTQLLVAHIPAMLDRQPHKMCMIGLGSGMTLGAIARHEKYERFDCVEISDAVIEAAGWFSPYNDDILNSDERVRMIRGDGRNHLLLTQEMYDLIISEPSNPWISGVSNLFTREFFEICKHRLNPQGRLTVWMHTYSMSPADFKMVVRTLTDTFGFVALWQFMNSDYCMVAGDAPFHVPAGGVLDRYAQGPVRADLYRAGIRDAAGVVGLFVAGGQRLREWAASASLHTDDNAILEFSAPRSLYRQNKMEVALDLAGIQQSPFEETLLADSADPATAKLVPRVETVIKSRMTLPLAMELCRQGRAVAGFEKLLEAYEADLGNTPVYQNLKWIREAARRREVATDYDEQKVQQLADRMDWLPQPLIIQPQGATLPEIARTLQMMASKYRDKDWKTVLYYLDQAIGLAPDDGLIAASRVLALRENQQSEEASRYLAGFLQAHPGDGWASFAAGVVALAEQKNEEALSWFRRVLESGVVKPKQLAGDPRLASFREDPAFKAMIEKFAASQPE